MNTYNIFIKDRSDLFGNMKYNSNRPPIYDKIRAFSWRKNKGNFLQTTKITNEEKDILLNQLLIDKWFEERVK